MSALTLSQTVTAVTPGVTASFQGYGGTSPYTYSVKSGGAGGTIDASTGVYSTPSTYGETPQTLFDLIQVTDSANSVAYAKILVGTPILLLCDIIQTQLGLAQGRVYLWDQKIIQPTDSGLYVAISVPRCKPFGNSIRFDGSGDGLAAFQSTNMQATVDIDIISRGTSARDRKEEVVLALNSLYAQSQQEINSFYIGKLPANAGFLNLSNIDGAAIPYRYKISINMMYAVSKSADIPYFNTYQTPNIVSQP